MSIKFKSISYRNFKSVGNVPIVIELDKAKTTLITGKNGAGKSTLTSAICFALFGQDFTLNKPGLINSINKKQLEVIIDFDIGKKQYKVHRGIKPNIFKIWEDGKLLNEDSSSRDYQKILETQILKMDIRAFKQVVVIGGRSYTPFMQLKPNDRREFIEDLLDIRIFSTMGNLLKDKTKALKEEIRVINDEFKTIREKVKLQENFIKKLTEEKSLSVDKLRAGIDRLEQENAHHTSILDEKLEQDQILRESLLEYKTIATDIAVLRQEQKQYETSRKAYIGNIDFYSGIDTCPKCNQAIADEHREHIIDGARTEIDLCDLNLNEITIKMEKLQSKLAIHDSIQKDISLIQNEIAEIEGKIFSNIKMIKATNQQIEEMKNDMSSIDSEKEKLRAFAKQYIGLDKKKKEFLETYQYHDFVASVLTDGGIKTKIIKQYIPTINKLINKYLTALDFFVSFHLNENFDEEIKSRYRDTFKYDNFSDGQAARIDLALMFAWRSVAIMRNAVNTNLLFLDEADAAVDGDGSSLLTDLLNTVEKSNIFVISHKGDLLRDKFDRVLTFETRDNFTVLKDD